MGRKTVYQSCAAVLLSVVLSSAWAFTAPSVPNINAPDFSSLTPEQQKALNDARNAQNAGSGDTTGNGANAKPDTNEAMESSQQDLINAQSTAAVRKQSADNLTDATTKGTLLNKPQSDYEEPKRQAAEALLAAQKEYCGLLSPTVNTSATSMADIEKACDNYFSMWATPTFQKYASKQPISRYCYKLGTVTKVTFAGFGKTGSVEATCVKKAW